MMDSVEERPGRAFTIVMGLLAVVAFAGILTACGGSSGQQSAATETSGTVTDAYGATCARADSTTDTNGAVICPENSGPTQSDPNAGSDQSTMRFTKANYALLVGDPNSYKGATVNIVGQIFDVQQTADGIAFQMWADPANSEWNTIVVAQDTGLNLAQDDYVRVKGIVREEYAGQNAFGGDVSAPLVDAVLVTKTTVVGAAQPATHSLGRATYTQAGITVTVQRIDFATNETRVLVFITNNSSSGFSFYDSSAKLIVGGRQYDPTYSGDYPELSTDLTAGAHTSGYIVFPAVSSHGGVRMEMEGYSDDSNVGDYGSLVWRFSWS